MFSRFAGRSGLYLAVFATGLLGAATPSFAQPARGGEIKFPAYASVDELATQSDLWVMDVYYKPMRMIALELTDPKTGQKKPEFVWYICYRAFRHKLEGKTKENPTVNSFDPPIAPQQFIPEAYLMVTDNDRNEVFADKVIPEALAAINKREKGNYKSSVSIVGPIPDESVADSGDEAALEGVFMWRGVDPNANRYTVYLTGFSNGLRQLESEDGNGATQAKSIMQKYWRRGDRFDQREAEIVPDGDTIWTYR